MRTGKLQEGGRPFEESWNRFLEALPDCNDTDHNSYAIAATAEINPQRGLTGVLDGAIVGDAIRD